MNDFTPNPRARQTELRVRFVDIGGLAAVPSIRPKLAALEAAR
jgi:hypothetical protein